MLQNEKYAGDALLQKTVTMDFLTHKRVVNDGHVQQFYVENSHPAIVSKETFRRYRWRSSGAVSCKAAIRTGAGIPISTPFQGRYFAVSVARLYAGSAGV
jgi:site-specific DNA recombinase